MLLFLHFKCSEIFHTVEEHSNWNCQTFPCFEFGGGWVLVARAAFVSDELTVNAGWASRPAVLILQMERGTHPNRIRATGRSRGQLHTGWRRAAIVPSSLHLLHRHIVRSWNLSRVFYRLPINCGGYINKDITRPTINTDKPKKGPDVRWPVICLGG